MPAGARRLPPLALLRTIHTPPVARPRLQALRLSCERAVPYQVGGDVAGEASELDIRSEAETLGIIA
jgi:hypothetical protein